MEILFYMQFAGIWDLIIEGIPSRCDLVRLPQSQVILLQI